MSRNSEVLSTLSDLGIPVAWLHYSGNELLYATFFFLDETGALSSDDEERLTNYYLQVDIWNKPTSGGSYANYLSVESEIKNRLASLGYRRTGAYDLFEEDTKIQHRALRFKKIGAPGL